MPQASKAARSMVPPSVRNVRTLWYSPWWMVSVMTYMRDVLSFGPIGSGGPVGLGDHRAPPTGVGGDESGLDEGDPLRCTRQGTAGVEADRDDIVGRPLDGPRAVRAVPRADRLDAVPLARPGERDICQRVTDGGEGEAFALPLPHPLRRAVVVVRPDGNPDTARR